MFEKPMISRSRARARGAAALLAMLFLVLMTTLTVAMFTMATTNVQSAYNLTDVSRAQASAEAGARFMAYRFSHMTNRPKTSSGNITQTVATTLWPTIQQAIIDDFSKDTINGVTNYNKMQTAAERTWTVSGSKMTSNAILTQTGGATFTLSLAPKATDTTVVVLSSTGRYNQAVRTITMEFKIEKKIKFAVVGKVPIQLGRNTIVEGPIAMGTPNKFPPLLMLSDFMHFDTTLKNTLTAWNTFLQANHGGYDNRISVNNSVEYAAASNAGYHDVNGDAYIDEWDFFLDRFDANHDKAVSKAEFTKASTGQLYDANLFKAIDSINAPMYTGDPTRMGYMDDKLDDSDGYAKIRGYVMLAPTADAWTANLAPSGKDINDMIQGQIITTEPGQIPVSFGVNPSEMIDLDPANFEECANNFKARTGTNAGSTALAGGAKAVIKNKTLTATDVQVMKVTGVGSSSFQVNDLVPKALYDSVNASLPAGKKMTGTDQTQAAATEHTPYGSTVWQATYKRPVFKNMVFENVQIPKGMNALFDNCTFKGVTWVDGERDITTSGGAVTYDQAQGMNWSKAKLSGSGTFSKDSVLLAGGTPTTGQMVTKGSQSGNNLRFNNCEFQGPLAGAYATAYTHFANSWEFTGSTMFNNQVDDTATIVSPQVNIEMGSFTDPSGAPSKLVGVVVAGNIDIRGTSSVDGSVIVTGDGAGNTTLAYFGASDASTDPDAPMPEGGWGRLNIRYNPHRALPDGINIAIDIRPILGTYSEGIR